MVAHFLPYQGSKRKLAAAILDQLPNRLFSRVFEPFVGSGALTLAAAARGVAEQFVIGDSLAPLVQLWQQVLATPDELADSYAGHWQRERLDAGYYLQIRQQFNATQGPDLLFYLLVRCVKNAPRWNLQGQFNQTQDKRRLGTQPQRMRQNLLATSRQLRGRCTTRSGDFRAQLHDAGPTDLVYLDPPWLGTTLGSDQRYHAGLPFERLVAALAELNARKIPWLLSYDGRCGTRSYGAPLPPSLGARLFELDAGRSAQATLAGRNESTVEALYLSPLLA